MCLAIPARIIEVCEGDIALVEVGGVQRRISLALVDGVAVDDYVLVHAGYALAVLDLAEAERSLALFDEMASAGMDEATP